MKSEKRTQKENKILDAAEKIFTAVGFRNTRMEDVAKEVGMSKGSVYFYFVSKENLFMAVTHRAFQYLLDRYYAAVQENKNKTGKECVMALLKTYVEFSEKRYSYYELLLNYMGMIRSESHSEGLLKVSDQLKNSIYYRMIKDIHNLPISIVISEMKRGQKDGSIKNMEDPHLIYLTSWAMIVGHTELSSSNRLTSRDTIFQVDTAYWKQYTLAVLDNILKNPVPGIDQ